MVQHTVSEENQKIVLGTRGSALALAQAEMTEKALQEAHPGLEIEREIIKTTGDRRTDVPLSEVAKAEGHLDKGVFIKELEVALAEGEIDVAVHSLKDMPSELEDGFEIAAVLPRAPVGDALISRQEGGLAGLPDGALVATSSIRRQRQLKLLRPDLELADIRGNVPTRLRKLASREDLGAILLAEAGLLRLGYGRRIEMGGQVLAVSVLDGREFLPAAGQGAVALEVRTGDERSRVMVEAVNDAETLDAVSAERKFLELLGAGCETPVGVWSEIAGGELKLRARVFEEGNEQPFESEASGPRSEPFLVAQLLVDGLSPKES